MSEVRQIKISADAYRPTGTRKRKTQKVSHKGGDSPPGASVTGPANFLAARSIQANLASGGSKQAVITKTSPLAPPHEKPKVEEVKPAEPPAKPAKIILNPPKKSPKKIILAPPASPPTSSHAHVHAKPKIKSKGTRKVNVHLGGFKKRITRAKHIKKDSSEKSIKEIRKVLEEAKLIKPLGSDSKDAVPEEMIRGIYRDYMTLRQRAL